MATPSDDALFREVGRCLSGHKLSECIEVLAYLLAECTAEASDGTRSDPDLDAVTLLFRSAYEFVVNHPAPEGAMLN